MPAAGLGASGFLERVSKRIFTGPLAAHVPDACHCARQYHPGSASTSTKTEALALVLGGTFVILATVNGTTAAALSVDSGATDVMLPRNVVARLIGAGSLTHRRLRDNQDQWAGGWCHFVQFVEPSGAAGRTGFASEYLSTGRALRAGAARPGSKDLLGRPTAAGAAQSP